jgi:hypothetical protein
MNIVARACRGFIVAEGVPPAVLVEEPLGGESLLLLARAKNPACILKDKMAQLNYCNCVDVRIVTHSLQVK